MFSASSPDDLPDKNSWRETPFGMICTLEPILVEAALVLFFSLLVPCFLLIFTYFPDEKFIPECWLTDSSFNWRVKRFFCRTACHHHLHVPNTESITPCPLQAHPPTGSVPVPSISFIFRCLSTLTIKTTMNIMTQI